MSETESTPSERAYESVESLRDAIASYIEEIKPRLDDQVIEMVSMDVEAEDNRVTITINETDGAEVLPPTSGTWGVTPVERMHDVVVDAIQSAGRLTEYDVHPMDADGTRAVMIAPLRDNFTDQ
ncbi:hypothetical protein [Salinibaculum rarum]|uniref:hypothetical protein n=1 Tax=Salinibaculum rarum TaxID=3058903 RepID=UPI00265D94BA|nr:hypothetical protein [Salinibaculum sp. KK48]